MFHGFDEEIVAFTQGDHDVEALGINTIDYHEQASDDEETEVSVPEKLRRESMYVTMFSDMLDVVLTHESCLFSPEELNVFSRYRQLSQPARFLLVRLALRKGGKWHRSNLLTASYQDDLPNVQEAIEEICAPLGHQETPPPPPTPPSGPKTEMIVVNNKQVECITISDDEMEEPVSQRNDGDVGLDYLARSDEHATIQDMLGTLKLAELKELSKDLKCKIIGKRADIIQTIIQTSKTQSVLFSSNKDPKGKGVYQQGKQGHQRTLDAFMLRKPKSLNQMRQTDRLRDMVHAKTGRCVKLNDEFFKLLHRVNLVFFRSTTPTTTLLPLILTHTKASNPSRRNYPKYTATRSISIFRSRDELLAFEHALNIEKQIDDAMEKGPRQEGAEKVVLLFEQVYERWKEVVRKVSSGEGCSTKRMGVLVRFEEGHVLTRIVYKGAGACGTLKRFEYELEILTQLLDQRMWRQGLRGQWYERKALILMTHVEKTPEHFQEAKAIVEQGLDDPSTHIIYRPGLERRLLRLEKKLKIPQDERRCAGRTLRSAEYSLIRGQRIFKPEETTPAPSITAHYRPISRSASLATVEDNRPKTPTNLTPLGRSHVSLPVTTDEISIAIDDTTFKAPITPTKVKGKGKENADNISSVKNRAQTDKTKKGKSIWKGKDGEVNVEQFVLEHYETKGYKGLHAEGRIVTHLFCLLFWSILFDDTIEGAFETCYQSAPLDLSHDTFYPARREAIDKRLQEIETDVDRMLDIIREVDDRERPRKTWAQGARWDMFELQDTLEIAEGLGGKTLGVICKLLCEEYGKRASGVPDLIVWNAAIKDAHFVEVKGPGDSLQENQKLWIDVLVGCGATVEVCRVENLDYQSPPRKQRKAGGKKAKSKASKRKAHSVEMESEDEHVAPQISDMELKMDEEKVPVSPVGRPQKRDMERWNDVPDISPATKRQKLVSAS